MSYTTSCCQTSQFVKSIHNSSPISLASQCRLLCYPREDRCGSKVLWDPDGTFLTIRFRLPLENDPLPVRDTNISSSASNETTPPDENLKNTFSFLDLVCLCLKWKANDVCLLTSESCGTSNFGWEKKKSDLSISFRRSRYHIATLYIMCYLSNYYYYCAQMKLSGGRIHGFRFWFPLAVIQLRHMLY